VFGGTCSLRADVRLAILFQDHAVLQRDRPLPMWGWADPGERMRGCLTLMLAAARGGAFCSDACMVSA